MTPGRTPQSIILDEARRRGLIDPSRTVLDAETAFCLVREMPYRRASNRDPETTIREWRGTCSGKHYLLRAILEELGYEVSLRAATAWVPPEFDLLLPEEGRGLRAEGPIPDLHNYLRVRHGDSDFIVDATAPLEWTGYGIPVNQEFIWGRDMQPLFEPIEEFEVPGDIDPQEFKARLLAEHFTRAELDRRDRFFTAVAGTGTHL